MPGTRYVTEEPERNPEERFRLYRLCDCPICEGRGKVPTHEGYGDNTWIRCEEIAGGCRGEGRVRQEIASCGTPEAVGVAIVTLAREGEWEGCPMGLLDTLPDCETCEGYGVIAHRTDEPLSLGRYEDCATCKGSGVKSTGTWLVLPWLPSARNVSDAGRTLARSKRK